MMVKRILVILLSCFAVVSCKTARIKKELKEFTGQQIVLPDSLRSTVNGRDTTLTGFMDAETKLVVFYDSVVCSSWAGSSAGASVLLQAASRLSSITAASRSAMVFFMGIYLFSKMF